MKKVKFHIGVSIWNSAPRKWRWAVGGDVFDKPTSGIETSLKKAKMAAVCQAKTDLECALAGLK